MQASINTLFFWCNDIAAMRTFYSQLLGLDETYHNEAQGWLTYAVGGVQVVFIRASSTLPLPAGWAKTPAWQEGTAEVPSLVIQYPLDDYRAVVDRAQQAHIQLRGPTTDGSDQTYRMCFMRDPMGSTVEIYFEAAKP